MPKLIKHIGYTAPGITNPHRQPAMSLCHTAASADLTHTSLACDLYIAADARAVFLQQLLFL